MKFWRYIVCTSLLYFYFFKLLASLECVKISNGNLSMEVVAQSSAILIPQSASSFRSHTSVTRISHMIFYHYISLHSERALTYARRHY
jgi:hypothetical protein